VRADAHDAWTVAAVATRLAGLAEEIHPALWSVEAAGTVGQHALAANALFQTCRQWRRTGSNGRGDHSSSGADVSV
jgi:hypothetical protein